MSKNHLYTHIIFSIFIVLLSFAGCGPSQTNSDGISLHPSSLIFEEELAISEEAVDENDFIMFPVNLLSRDGMGQIRTDDEGNIYLPDHSAVTIRVFDRHGHFLHNIGRQGSGPGEFERISAIDVFGNELSVFDMGNNRIVRFFTTGVPIGVISSDEITIPAPVSLHRLEEEQYLYLYKSPDNTPHQEENYEQHISFFHHFDEGGQSLYSSFANANNIIDIQSGFTDWYVSTMNTGRVWIEKDTLWFTPGVYEGHIFKFVKTGNFWKKSKKIEGYSVSGQAVQEGDNEEGAIEIVRYFPRYESFSGKVLSTSLGIFKLNNGNLIHISSQMYEEERQTIVELFSPEGELKSVGRLEQFTFDKDEREPKIGPFWKDQTDRFYVLDYNGEEPVLRAGHIKGWEPEDS